MKKKVVILHNIVSPHITPLFKEIAKKVDLTILYCATKEDNRSWNQKPAGYDYKVLPNFSIQLKGKDLFTYFINPTLINELSTLKPNIVIAAGWDLFAYQVAFFYCKIKKIRFILWSGSTKYENSWRRVISKPLVKLMVRNSDALIAYGTRAKEYMVTLGADPKKIFISYNTTDINKFSRLSKKYEQKSEIIKKRLRLTGKKVIMYYGQIIERKGIDLLIKAFSKIKNKLTNTGLIIVGSGPFESECKELIDDLKLSDVIFIKDPGDEKVCLYYALSDLFVLPSREEVWGLVVNEAMACGLPVIVSSAVGSGVDMIKSGINGFIFENNSVEDLTKKIIIILADNTNFKKSAERNSQGIISMFTAKATVKGVFDALDSIWTK